MTLRQCYFGKTELLKTKLECEWFRSWELKNRLFEPFFKGVVSCQLFFLGFDSFPFHYRAAQLRPIIDLFLINSYQFMNKLPISSIPQFFTICFPQFGNLIHYHSLGSDLWKESIQESIHLTKGVENCTNPNFGDSLTLYYTLSFISNISRSQSILTI